MLHSRRQGRPNSSAGAPSSREVGPGLVGGVLAYLAVQPSHGPRGARAAPAGAATSPRCPAHHLGVGAKAASAA